MFLVVARRAVLSLLLLTGSIACAQTGPTPAARQQQSDRTFLLRRGIAVDSQRQAPSLPPPRSASIVRSQAVPSGAAAVFTGAWQPLGPMQVSTPAYGLVTGRVSSLAVDPNDTSGNTVYLGATGGGVWKSTNAAAGSPGNVSFIPLTDALPVFANSNTSIPSLSIGALTVEPGNSQVLLAGTGDPNDALDSYYGVGILRSTNGGNSWSLVQQSSDLDYHYSMQGVGFAGFAWSTATPNLVVAAASQSLEGLLVNTGYRSSAETGLYYSKDAGQTWNLATVEDSPTQIIQSSDPRTSPPGNPATAVVWNPKRNVFIAAVRFHGYYSSSDGVMWTRLVNQPGANLSTTQCPANPGGVGNSRCPLFRGALAVQPATGDTFALTTDYDNVDQGLYQDVCSTNGIAVSACASDTISFGTQIADSALDADGGVIPQADYNLALSAVASQQDTILFAGTEDIYNCSLADSCAWRNTTNDQTCAAAQVAPSTHAIDSTFGAKGLIYFGNDGGLWRSTDTVAQTGSACAGTDAAHFQNLNAGIGSLAEISRFAVSPSNGSLVLAGMGGFGVVSNAAGAGPWQQLLTGEGSYVAINPTTPANWYADSGPGVSIFSCANGGNCNASGFGDTPVIARAQVENDADYFLDAAPWILDPPNPANILLGTCRIWLGPAGGDWTSSSLLSTMLDGNQASFCDGNAQLRSIGAGGSYNSAQGGEQVYAGMAGPLDGGGSVPGHLYGATVPQGGDTQSGANVAWTDLWRNPVTNTSLSSQFNAGGYAISSIAVDPHDSTGKTVYVGIAGFPFNQSGMLYGSTDGGAHWLNLTNSLPYSPVNSVVVDPSNAGYIYVGGDFGVYYTTNVASCGSPSLNCWTQLSSGLPNAPVTDLQVYSSGTGTVLEAGTYGRGIWTLGLATTTTRPQATLSPGSFSFPAQATGSQSSTIEKFTLANTGSVPLSIAQVDISPGDYAQTNTCGSSLAANSSCQVSVTFTPVATGNRPGTLTVSANTQSGALTATLDGSGVAAGAVALTPGSLAFATTATGTSSAPQTITVKNTGGASTSLGSPIVTGANANDFSIGSGSTCGSTLPAGATCTIPITFNPVQTGARAAQLQLTSSAPGSPFTAGLSGNAVSPATVTLSPQSLTFPNTPQGNDSAAQSITVTNSGGVPAQLGAATVSPNYRIAANSCGAGLAANGGQCSVSIEFAPTATGNLSGLFTLPSSSVANNGSLTAPLSGTGLQPADITLSTTSLNFGNQQQGTASSAMAVLVSNSSGSTATLGAPSITGDYAYTSTCPATLVTGSSCSINVTFTPAGTGSRSGILSVPYNNTSAPVALAGTGTAPAMLGFSPASLAFPATAKAATSAALTLVVTNSGSNPAQIASLATAAPFAISGSNCPSAPQTLAVSATCTLSVTFSPSDTVAYTGALTLTGKFSNSPAAVPLSGQGANPPNATLTPNPVPQFPDTAAGSTSVAQNLTITSTGGVPVTLGLASVTADYQITSPACSSPLAPGQACTISILFHPSGAGPQPGTFTQTGNMPGASVTASLSGNGLTPGAVTLSPVAFNFGSQVIGTSAAAHSFLVSNSGQTSVTLGAPLATPGDYTIAGNTCGSSLSAGQTCTINVAFKPATAGSHPGQLTIPGTGSAGSAVVTLEGAGVTAGALVLSPSSLAFGNVATGNTANNSFKVTNNGGSAVHLSSVAASGDFSITGGTCSTGNAIAADGGACTIAVTFTPGATGSRTGLLTLANDGSPPTVTAQLTGTGATPGSLSLTPSSLQFGSVVLGAAPVAQTVTATNSGGLPVQLSTAAVTGAGYSIQNDTCGASLGAGTGCTLQVVFTPAAAAESRGTLSLPGQYSGATASVALDGAGVTPGALTFTPSTVLFGSVVVGSTATQSISVQNTGGSPVTLGTPSTSAGFAVVSQCGPSLLPKTGCILQVSFSPTANSAINGLLTMPESATGSSSSGNAATVSLSGNGVAAASIIATPTSVSYAATATGGSSAAQTVTFRNTGGISVSLAAPQLSIADYTITGNTCGASLEPGAACAVGVAFAPTASGDRPGALTLSSSTGNGPAAHVALEGAGLSPAHLAFTPGSINFGSHAENTTTPSQSLTLTNTGGVSTTLGLPTISGEFAVTSRTCGTTLAAAANCSIAVQFVPASRGTQTGTLTIAGNGGSPAASATLSGTGLALILSPASYTFTPAVAVGVSLAAPTYIAVQNLGATTIALTAPSVTGDFAIGASTCGASLAASSSCSIDIIFTPAAAGQRTGTFTISDGPESGATTLFGTGLSPATDTLSPGALLFGPTVIGNRSAPQSVILTNSGDSTLARITAVATGPFLVANNCGASLGGPSSCAIAVTYAPTALGTETGTLTVTDAQRSQIVSLTGQGTAPPQAFATPSNINFGPYAIAVATPVQTVTVSNQGATPMGNISTAVSSADFTVASSTCGQSLAPGASCRMGILFMPDIIGNREASLTINSPSLAAPLTVSLAGSGEDYALSVVGNATNVITQGQSATYQLAVTPVGASAGSVAITCSGTPVNSTCIANPATLMLAGGVPGSVAVTIATDVTTARLEKTGWKTGWIKVTAALAFLCPLLFLRREQRRRLLLGCAALALLCSPIACGVHASGVNTGKPAGPGQTPSGSYSVIVTAAFPGAQRTTSVTLVVQ